MMRRRSKSLSMRQCTPRHEFRSEPPKERQHTESEEANSNKRSEEKELLNTRGHTPIKRCKHLSIQMSRATADSSESNKIPLFNHNLRDTFAGRCRLVRGNAVR